MIRFFRLPLVFRLLYPKSVFRLGKTSGREVCLTFDDGPFPGTTPEILRILGSHGIKATFFCTGQNIEKYPGLFTDIVDDGHQIGNHGYNHIKGRETGIKAYIENAEKGANLTGTHLFRPPYGSITRRQYKLLMSKYQIIFWDLILYDFDKSFREGGPLNILRKKVRPGSVIVLHENAHSCAAEILDEAINWLKSSDYGFAKFPAT